jgi:hypothetical protein
VLDVTKRLVEQRRDVRVIKGVGRVAASASPDHETEIAQNPQLVRNGGLGHLDRDY